MGQTEKHTFQAEIQQLLNIVIHSLYTDKEIFIRELVSNAADALEKLRFAQSSGQPVHQPDLPLKITIETNETDNTVTITDTGIGMSHGELIENLGTIAHSGSKAFLQQLAEGQKADLKLIGQFGVGFYSAFMAAKRVTVFSRSMRPDESAWKWTSDGLGGYEIEPAEGDQQRGTKIVLELKEDQKEFAQASAIERLIKRYSGFVPFPIEVAGKAINTVQAIWARSKNEIKEEEYNEFYKYIAHEDEPPLFRLHFRADAPIAIQALLFVPSKNLEALGFTRTESDVDLYSKKVMIQRKAKGLFPEWLRFLRGVVDSEDMPLNISRETMQDSSLMQKLNRTLTSRFIKFLDEQSEKDPAKFETFYKEHSRFLKEGVIQDFTHRDALAKLLCFESSHAPKETKTSLAEYVKRMGSEQKDIYYLLAPNREAAESSPYYEVFASRKYEVLFLNEPIDEFVMDHLHQFDGKNLVAAEKADLGLDQKKEGGLSDQEAEDLAKWLKERLSGRVQDVQVSKRLVDSPAVVVDADKFITSSMRKMMKAMRRDNDPLPPEQYNLEINPAHPMIAKLASARQTDADLAGVVAEQILDNARVAAGLLEDPRAMLKRMNELLEKVLQKA